MQHPTTGETLAIVADDNGMMPLDDVLKQMSPATQAEFLARLKAMQDDEEMA